jgi:DNA polymerase-3 subunit delta
MKERCYLFLGPEIGEKKEAIDSVRAKIIKEDGVIPEEISFYAGENEISTIVSVALNGLLFADSKLILVKNAEQIKKKNEITAITDYIRSPQNSTTLILISDFTKIETAIEKCFEKELKDNKKIFWELFEEKKFQYVSRFFKQAGFTIEEPAVALILEFVENNTDALYQECSKIALFLKNDKNDTLVTEEKIERLLVHSRQETVFSLFSAIAAGDFSRSIDIAHTLLNSQVAPQAIFGFLAPAFRKFRDYCELVKNGRANDLELKKAGISILGKKDYINARRNYGDNVCNMFLSITSEYDVTVRTVSHSTEIFMDMYLYKIFSLKQKSGANPK